MATPTLVTVLGAGSWGSALAIQLARNGYHTTLWGRDVAQMSAMRSEQQNSRYLPGISFPQHLHPTSDLVAALQCPTTLLIVVPSGAFRHTLEQIQPLVAAGCDIAWATKGLEQGSGKLLHQVFAEVMGEERGCAVVSGPTFATEVAHGLPTAVTVAAVDEALASRVACQLHGESFRAYTSTDMVSVELGGACKNVLAIAAGIADGLGFGANTRAALITRGLAEMVRLGTAIGGSAETLMGLAGLGDLLLTCTDDQSRNRRVGLGLGRGEGLDQVIAQIGQAVEGVKSAAEILRLARQYQIEMPIVEQVNAVLFDGVAPQQAVESLLGRSPKTESILS